MQQFSELKLAVQRQFNQMKSHKLFRVDVDKELLYKTYLESFPVGTNPIYKERTEHDCNCCKSFIRNVGSMVAIIDNKLVSIWDANVGGFYQEVSDAMANLVKSKSIQDIFLHTENMVGVDKNHSKDANTGAITTFEHFFVQLPNNLVVSKDDLGTKLNDVRTTKDVMKRALQEISIATVDTVLELIAQGSLYRGEENTFTLESFKKLKREFDKFTTEEAKDIFCWSKALEVSQSVARIRNTSIGSLLVDLEKGDDLESAVKSFESKVAPTNYKRPTALVTKAMIEKAKKTIEELGLTSSLERRYAVLEDITINNVQFADRSAKKVIDNVFDDLSSKVPTNTKKINKVEEVSIDSFISDILPKIDSMEVLLENKHSSNLVSLIAPCDLTSKGMFKWDNSFSWSYTGELTDSIKERVKNAGGKVDGDLRCSLSWYNNDDLDLHMVEPNGYEIFFSNRRRLSSSKGMLDVDMNGCDGKMSRTPVENICYENRNSMQEGTYKLYVNQYNQRESKDVGFEVEIEFDGTTYTFSYDKVAKGKILVATIQYTKKDGFKILESLPSTQAVKNLWGLSTQSFHRVNVAMLSPNYWDGNSVGNKHYFFMLEGCLNDSKARGFFNEFLKAELDQHRKVLEIVGSKMKTEESDRQLSGLGFSSTQRNSLLCKVSGSFTRTLKINF